MRPSNAHGIAKNHPFSDGNKRTAFVCAAAFLGVNGVRLTLSEPGAVEVMLALAAGEIGQEDVEKLIRENSGAIRKGQDRAHFRARNRRQRPFLLAAIPQPEPTHRSREWSGRSLAW